MGLANDNARFIEAARTQGMLTEPAASDMLNAAGDSDVAATLVLQRGLMDARQVDIIQTLISGDTAIPGYTIIDIIGHGGMGVVFRARQDALHRDVALKTILVGGRVDEAIQRFRNEATSVARLNHPNIVTAYDFGEYEGRIYYSMELVEGQNVTDYVQHRGRLSAAEALAITRQAALGLAHAWQHRIVHRDIKPDNLLLTTPSEFDQSRTVKIADLGLAHLQTEASAARITQTGAAIGSPLYMPPEQLGGGDVDCRSDIYSLGSTLFFMLSGRPPFDGDSVSAVLYNKANGKSVPLADVADVDDSVVRLVDWMMDASAEERPRDYRVLVNAIDEIQGLSAAAAPSSSPSASLAATQLSASATAFRQEAMLSETSITSPASETTPESGAPGAESNRQQWLLTALVGLAVAAAASLIWQGLSSGPPVPIIVERLKTEETWADPLFDGLTMDDWDQPSAGTPWQVDTDPVEQAFAISGRTREEQSGSIRRKIPKLLTTELPWFEVELNVLLESAQAAGIQFAATESTSGLRLEVTEQTIRLLNEADTVLGSQTPPYSPSEQPLNLRIRLQPNGWLVEANDQAIASAPPRPDMLPEIRLFLRGGAAYFSGIKAIGLQMVDSPR